MLTGHRSAVFSTSSSAAHILQGATITNHGDCYVTKTSFNLQYIIHQKAFNYGVDFTLGQRSTLLTTTSLPPLHFPSPKFNWVNKCGGGGEEGLLQKCISYTTLYKFIVFVRSHRQLWSTASSSSFLSRTSDSS